MNRYLLLLPLVAGCLELPPTITANDPEHIEVECPATSSFPSNASEFNFELAEGNAASVDGAAFSFVGDLAASDDTLFALRACAFDGACTPGHRFLSLQTCGPITLSRGSGLVTTLAATAGLPDGGIEAGVVHLSQPFRLFHVDGGMQLSGAVELADGRTLRWNAFGSKL